jgi:type VI secretion system secreted protein Hcp
MEAEFFLKLDGIKGDSTSAGHKGEIELLSWSLSSPQVSPRYSAGTEAGKVTATAFSVMKTNDGASYPLFLLNTNGDEIPNGVVTISRKGASSWLLRYKFTKLTVENIQWSGSGSSDDRPLEYVTFKFKDGKLDPHSTAPP